MSMQLLEIKNDIAKITYNPADNKLLPSDFLLIEDFNQKLVGQVLSIYTTENSTDNIADVRLALYIDKDEKLSYYNGYIPPRTANVLYITSDEITEMIANSDSNIYLGNLTYHPKSFVKAPLSLVNERLYIQCDREDNTKIIVQNIVSALYMKQRKVILIDFDGRYNRIANVPRLVVSESFKFPLNVDAFNNILEYDTVDCPLEDKAVIQGIVLELRDYIRTLENKYLPFTLFKNVVISEFAANPISGLMVLRNKLWQYAQEGLFAESKNDFDIINTVMQNENIVIVDASKIEEKWHKFVIQTIPDILKKNCYFAFSMNDIAMDKRSIISLYNNPNIVPIVSTSYDSPNRGILKSLSKNQILFKPSKRTEVDEQYGALIHKLSDNDFILYGEASLNLPLIIDLKPFDIKTTESVADLEIKRNVDRILSTGKSMLPKEAVLSDVQENSVITEGSYVVDDDFTDEDLDFIDNIKQENISIEDIKNKKPDNEQNNGYGLFDPYREIEKPQEDVSEPISETIEINDIQNVQDIKEEQSSSSDEPVQGCETKVDSDFDDLLNESQTEISEPIQYNTTEINEIEETIEEQAQEITEEKENQETLPVEIVEHIEDNQSEQIDNEIIESREDVLDTPIKDLIVNNEDNEIILKEEEFLEEKKEPTRTKQSVAGYFKNDAAQMDFIPDEPTLETFGDLKYKENDGLVSGSGIASVDSLSMDDIEGFGFGERDSDFIEIDENGNELIEDDFDVEFLTEEQTSSNDDEKKNVKPVNKGQEEKKIAPNFLAEDEKALEQVFDDELITIDTKNEEISVENPEVNSQTDSEDELTLEEQFDGAVDEESQLDDISEEQPNSSDETNEQEEKISLDDEFFGFDNIAENAIEEEKADLNEEISIEDELFSDDIVEESKEISIEDEFFSEEAVKEITPIQIGEQSEIKSKEEKQDDTVNKNRNLSLNELFSENELSKEDKQPCGAVDAAQGCDTRLDKTEKTDEIEIKTPEKNEDEYTETEDDTELDKQVELNTEDIEIKEEPKEEEIIPVKEEKRPQSMQIQKKDEIVAIDNIVENIKMRAKSSLAEKKVQNRQTLVQENRGKNILTPDRNAPKKIQQKKLTVYETDTSNEVITENTLPFKVGDRVYHPKHGNGVVEGFANYSNKILFCQIEFENIGRRILDPRISGLEKIDG